MNSVSKLEGGQGIPHPKDATGKDAAAYIASYLNVIGDGEDIAAFVAAMREEHRTLQQGFTRLVVAWLHDLAKREHFDLRNEASVKLARKLLEGKDEFDTHLPLI